MRVNVSFRVMLYMHTWRLLFPALRWRVLVLYDCAVCTAIVINEDYYYYILEWNARFQLLTKFSLHQVIYKCT